MIGESLGARIRDARNDKGLTQTSLARAAGVNKVNLCRLEKGIRTRPAAETVYAIARALNVSMEWLFNGGDGAASAAVAAPSPRPRVPIQMLLWCPVCHERHIDAGEFATKPHHTHACQACGMVWRPAVVPTVGVAFLPGFKDEPTSDGAEGRTS